MNRDELINIALVELKNICEEDNIDTTNFNSETVLFGSEGVIDSLGLIALVVKIEDYVAENSNKEIQIIDENAIVLDGQPLFKNLSMLVDLALAKLNEK